MPPPDYDYIIAGAGCSGLSLLIHLFRSGLANGKKILLVDRAPKTANDRTWCFWEKEPGPFEELVCRHWDRFWFHGPGEQGDGPGEQGYSSLKDIRPYSYKMIRGIDFYTWCFDQVRRREEVTVAYGSVENLHSDTVGTSVIIDGEKITARYIFSSIRIDAVENVPRDQPPAPKGSWSWLQHFKGWRIRSATPVFDPAEATLMDFRVSQQPGTAFVYTMPFSDCEALIEYTLFSETLLAPADYEAGLREYIGRVPGIRDYTILEEEFGVIPMTNRPCPTRHNNIIYLGTAGGRTKASSGYTFQFIQKQSRAIVRELAATGKPFVPTEGRRFGFYDSVLLNVLVTGKAPGADVFTDLFRKNKTSDIFSFLDNESSLAQDWRIIRSLPAGPFLKAGLQELF